MNRHKPAPSDSLDLLLDTMCNAFGGIILVALLVTLIASDANPAASPASPGTEPDAVHAIATAEAELQAARELLRVRRQTAEDPTTKALTELLQTRDARRRALESIEQEWRDAERAGTPDPAGSDLEDRIRRLNLDERAAESGLADAKAAAEALRRRRDSLTERVRQAQATLARQPGRQVQRMRLPVERPRNKSAVFVIARHGRIYPVQKLVAGDLVQNTKDLRWHKAIGRGEQAEPIVGQGLDPRRDAAALEAFLRRLSSKDDYLVFLVFADSFAAFNIVKQAVVRVGLDYGWEAWKPDEPVVFGQGGRLPAPPL